MQQTVCGLIGPVCTAQARTKWNALFREYDLSAFFDFYRTRTREDLELRLSEMFLLERKGYVVAPELQMLILPLLDRLDESAMKKRSVDTVMNEGGVLIGFYCGDDVARMKVWF